MDSVKIYEPVLVIEKAETAGLVSKISCVECCGRRMFIGTHEGVLKEYVMLDDNSDLKFGLVRQINLQNKPAKQLQSITFIRAASALGLLLVVQGGILCLYDLSTFEKRPGTLNGISLIAVDESVPDPFALHMSIIKKGSVVLISVGEKGVTTIRDFSVESPPLALSVDGGRLCLALSNGKYIMVDYRGKSIIKQELCTFDPKLVSPAVAHFAKDEFVVLGPVGLGVFVTSQGTSERPPINWPEKVSSLAVDGINVVGVGEDFIFTHSVVDVVKCNIIKFSGVKFASVCEGKLFVSTNSNLYKFKSVSIHQQVQGLLEGEEIEKAFDLLKFAPLKEEGKVGLRKQIHISAVFKFISTLDFELARESLTESEMDTREILRLFPKLLPSRSTFRPSHNLPFPDVRYMYNDDEDKVLKLAYFVIDVLMDNPNSTFASKDLSTCLVKLCSMVEFDRYLEILRRLRVMDVDSEDLIEWLQKSGLQNHLAHFYATDGYLKKAIDIWMSLIPSQPDVFDSIVNKLKECKDPELVRSYFKDLVKLDPSAAIEIYKGHRATEGFEPLSIAESLHPFPSLAIEYLEHCIEVKNLKDSDIHTYLAAIYIDQILKGEERLRDKLKRFIITSNSLRVNFLIGKVQGTKLRHELALLHGKAGDHLPALEVLTKEINDHNLAKEYCAGISNLEERKKAYILLIKIYVESSEGRKGEAECLSVLQDYSKEFDLSEILALLPDTWSLQTFKPLFTTALRASIHKKRTAQMKKNLGLRLNVNLKLEEYALNQGYEFEAELDCDSCKNPIDSEDGFVLKNEKHCYHNQCA